LLKRFHQKGRSSQPWLTEYDDVITPRLRRAPHLGLALGPAPSRAGPDCDATFWSNLLRFLA